MSEGDVEPNMRAFAGANGSQPSNRQQDQPQRQGSQLSKP